MKQTITCMCEAQFEREFPDVFEIRHGDDAEASIIDGSFLSLSCPECSKVLKPEFPVLVEFKDRGITVRLVPEMDRLRFYSGKVELDGADQAVIGFAELRERALEYACGVEPDVVECIKYYLYEKAQESNPDREASIYFEGIEDGLMLFHILGLVDGEVGKMKLPVSFKEKVASELAAKRGEDPFKSITEGPYVSVRKYLEAKQE
jgi:hypothetical protein